MSRRGSAKALISVSGRWGAGLGNEDPPRPPPTEGGVRVLAGFAGALSGAPRQRRAARVSHPPRGSSPPRWPVVQKLFPRVPHVKDPVGDSFQNERMVGGRRCAGAAAGWGRSGAVRPAQGSGRRGARFPPAVAEQRAGQGSSPQRRGSESPPPEAGVPCPGPCAIRGFPGRTCRPAPCASTYPQPLRPADGLGPRAGEPGGVSGGPGAGVGGSMNLMQPGASFFRPGGGRAAGPGWARSFAAVDDGKAWRT